MVPTPTPAPPMPMQAMPAPMYFAATGSMESSSRECLGECGRLKRDDFISESSSRFNFMLAHDLVRKPVSTFRDHALVARVNGVVEVDAGQDGEHIGLQEGDQQLERGEDHDHHDRQGGAEPAGDADAG